MELKTEICDNGDELIIIKCRKRTDEIIALEKLINTALNEKCELVLFSKGTEHYVNKAEILFFEAEGNTVYAHTADRMLKTEHRLFELEDLLPNYFVRVSKSVIVNVKQISSLRRELMGGGELCFKSGDKKTYFSRSYHSRLKEKIKEIRL